MEISHVFSAALLKVVLPKVSQTEDLSTPRGFTDLREILIQQFPRHDVLFIDANEKLPTSLDVIRLKYASYKFLSHDQVSVVMPKLELNQEQFGIYDLDFATHNPVKLTKQQAVYGQQFIPRMTRLGHWHSAFLHHDFVKGIEAPVNDFSPSSFSAWIDKGWEQLHRSLILPPVTLEIGELPDFSDFAQLVPPISRTALSTHGLLKVIFVLPATSISGGIRTVFEQADGLAKRGFEIEIWALQGQPEWFELKTQVKKFASYSDMIDALRFEDAFKISTWWETAAVVWQGSTHRGIPIYFVQEFESWFYPDNDSARAAVANTYRHELNILTIADYTRGELEEVGVSSAKIPVAYNSDTFFQEPNISRESFTVMAVGRSFFQKNFELTLNAWKKIPSPRPRLSLFGIEPNIAQFPEVEYEFRPSDDRVRELYNSATCFVQTSLHEGFCLPVLEAMASGCPVITTDSHGNRDFCIDGYNCLIVEQGNEDELSRTIQLLLSDVALQQKLREGGLETASRYTWDVVLQQTSSFLKELEETYSTERSARG